MKELSPKNEGNRWDLISSWFLWFCFIHTGLYKICVRTSISLHTWVTLPALPFSFPFLSFFLSLPSRLWARWVSSRHLLSIENCFNFHDVALLIAHWSRPYSMFWTVTFQILAKSLPLLLSSFLPSPTTGLTTWLSFFFKLDSLPIFRGKSYLRLSKFILNWTVKVKNNSYADNAGLTDCYIITSKTWIKLN